MPNLTLTYDLDTERNAAEIAVKSLDFALAWNELREWVRQKIKYENCDIEFVRSKMYEIETDRSLPEVE